MSSVQNLRGEALAQAVEVAVLKEGLDTAKVQGEAAVKLIEEAGDAVPKPPVVAKNPALGQLVDFYM
ncbi:MAG: putative motility protein [Deltaproteobacteria bacterium]|nr:putative motility protein [Deltaproteobacteria bacterium]